MLTQEKNYLTISPEALKPNIDAHITFLEDPVKALKQQLRTHIKSHESLQAQADLLESIVGIGSDTAARLLAEIGDIKALGSARQLAAYAGLTPQEHTSGTSVNGKTRLCKIGNARLRKALFFPAMVFLHRSLVLRGVSLSTVAQASGLLRASAAIVGRSPPQSTRTPALARTASGGGQDQNGDHWGCHAQAHSDRLRRFSFGSTL